MQQVLHKRQISEAIPREERENERIVEGPQQAPQEKENDVTQGGVAQATRKSQRARKPKRRN
jgi:hypothetical protein